MLKETESEADRDGTFSVDSVLKDMDKIIGAAKR